MTKEEAAEPVAWRSRFKGGKWTVQKNKPHWHKPGMPDVDLEPLYSQAYVLSLRQQLAEARAVTDDMIGAAIAELDKAHQDVVGFVWHDGSKLFIRDFSQDKGKIVWELPCDTKTYPAQHKAMMDKLERIRWHRALSAAMLASQDGEVKGESTLTHGKDTKPHTSKST